MNVLILAAGQVEFNAHDGNYPLCLAELDGVPLIQRLIQTCAVLGDANFIVALREQDIRRYRLDNSVALLAPNAKIVSVRESTRGAACTALLASKFINNDEELLILNGNEIIDVGFLDVIEEFRARQLNAGVVTFLSVHPRYSYVRLSTEKLVVEAAEKNPISRHAIAGFYWFRQGRDFVRAVENMIRKDVSVNDRFYISPALNELILERARIGMHPIDTSKYHPLKTERQLMQFEAAIDHRRPV
jgi:dTDP-glucose pyrophosphorylase